MTTTIPSLPRKVATLKTRCKAHLVAVVRSTRCIAYVEGVHDTYAVDLRTLACSCPTPDGDPCSHAMQVIEWQARRLGYRGAIFPRSLAAGRAELEASGYTCLPGSRAGYQFLMYR